MKRFVFVLVVFLMSGSGCDDESAGNVSSPTSLSITPELLFSNPEVDREFVDAAFEIKNVSPQNIVIREVSVAELDPVKELEVIGTGGWSKNGVALASGSTLSLSLRWSIIDPYPEQGAVTIISDVGVFEIPYKTPPIVPLLEWSVEPLDGSGQVEVESFGAASAVPIVVSIHSRSLSSLSVSTICLLDSTGQCELTNRSSGGAFELCEGKVDGPRDCVAPGGKILQKDELAQLTVLYRPGSGETEGATVSLLFNTDDPESPQVILELSGTPCAPVECGDGLPEGDILSPEPGSVFIAGEEIVFSGAVSDNEDLSEQLVVTWLSSLDGPLSLSEVQRADSTEVTGIGVLSEGVHTITMTVEDSDLNLNVNEVVIEVEALE